MSDKDQNSTRDLDLIPAIAPEKDELDSRRRSLSAPKPSNFKGLLVFSLVLMAVMLGVGGFTLFEVQQRLDESNTLLDQANQGVRDLEARLAATGTDVSKELQTLKEQQETNFSEIDKLWKVAYRENRPAIGKLEDTVSSMTAANQKMIADINGLSEQVKGSIGRFGEMTAAMNKLRADLLSDNEELTTALSMVRGQVQDQAVVNEAQKRSIAALTKQLKDVDEAINAIDRYRQQVNQRLLELQSSQSSQSGG